MNGSTLSASPLSAMVMHTCIFTDFVFMFSLGAPVLYMALCIPLGFALPGLEDSYGYITNTTDIV